MSKLRRSTARRFNLPLALIGHNYRASETAVFSCEANVTSYWAMHCCTPKLFLLRRNAVQRRIVTGSVLTIVAEEATLVLNNGGNPYELAFIHGLRYRDH